MKFWKPPCLLALLALFLSACSSTGLQRLALVTMAYTILLIPVALLGLPILGAAVAIGWIAWGTILGQLAFRLFSIRLGAGWAAFGGTLLFGLAQAGLSSIPTLGSLLNLLLALTGFEAVFLTRFGLQAFHPQAIEESLS